MDPSFAVPVATHVARREAGLSITRGKRVTDGFGVLRESIADRAWLRFEKGRRLDGRTLNGLVGEIRSFLDEVSPLARTESSRPATRVHPKGEAFTFKSLHGFGGNDGRGDVRSLLSLRITLTRKRAVIDEDCLGMTVTRHLLERSIERNLVAWTGGLREVDEMLDRHQGLAVLWRWAIISRRIPEALDAHLPFGDGLILGRFRIFNAKGCCDRYVVDYDGGRKVAAPPNAFLTEVCHETGEPLSFLEYLGTTTVKEEQMRMEQIDYRDAISVLERHHGVLLANLRHAVSWRDPEDARAVRFFDIKADMDRAADDLAAIALHPRLGSALRSAETGLMAS